MRLIRSLAALGLLKAGYWMLERADGLRPRCCHDDNISKVCASRIYHRSVERMLLASLVGMFIAGLWIWFAARAAG